MWPSSVNICHLPQVVVARIVSLPGPSELLWQTRLHHPDVCIGVPARLSRSVWILGQQQKEGNVSWGNGGSSSRVQGGQDGLEKGGRTVINAGQFAVTQILITGPRGAATTITLRTIGNYHSN